MHDLHHLRGALDAPAVDWLRGVAQRLPPGDKSSVAAGLHLLQTDKKLLVDIILRLFDGPIAREYDRLKGVRIGVLLNFLTVRTHLPQRRQQFVKWHTDSNFASINLAYPAEPHLMTAWVPLDDCGVTRPSLEFVSDMSDDRSMRYAGFLARDDRRSFTDDELAEIIGAFETKVLMASAGDALLFGQYAIHRTQTMGPQFDGRTAVEFRLAKYDAVERDPRGLVVATVELWQDSVGEDHRVVRVMNTVTRAFADFDRDGRQVMRA